MESCKRVKQLGEDSGELVSNWARLPQEILLHIFQYLPLLDRAFASQVCRVWNQAFHMPELWRCFEFELNQPASSYLKATHPDLIKQIIKRHSNHLQYVSFKVRCLQGDCYKKALQSPKVPRLRGAFLQLMLLFNASSVYCCVVVFKELEKCFKIAQNKDILSFEGNQNNIDVYF